MTEPENEAPMATTFRDPAERGGYLRLFYRDWRPTRLGRLVNGVWAWLSGLGLTPRILLTLQVKGRRSGRLRISVLVVARHDGQLYPVSERGPILKTYCHVATSGRHHFPVAHNALVSEFDAVADRYPVFRIDPV